VANDNDPRQQALYALGNALKGQQYTVKHGGGDPQIDIVGDGGKLLTVACASRGSDGGRLWFFETPGIPLAEADNIPDAIVSLKSRLSSGG
jgi:hypothetical protein